MNRGKLPEGWGETEIGDIADVISGGTPKSGIAENFAPSGEGIAWLTPADLSGYKKKFISHGARDLSTEGYSSCSAKLMPAGAILFSSRAPIGYVAVASNEISTNQGFKSFVFTNDIYPDYAYYYLRNIRHLAEELGTGTTFKEISGSAAKTLPFVMAPLAEQKIIAEKLDTLLAQVDSTKARLEQTPQILKRFRQAVLGTAVNGNLTKHWRDFNNIQNWTNTNWEGILKNKKDSFKRGPFGSALKKSMFVSEGYKVYEQYCPINDDCSYARYFITEDKFNEMKSFEVLDGDFLISCSGVSLGRITQVPQNSAKGIINQALLRVRINNEVYLDSFFKLLFRSPMFQKKLFDNSTGSAIPNLKGVKELKAMEIPLLSLEEQHEIVRRVEQLFAWADTIEKQVNNALTRVNNLTQSILAKAFRGELTAQWRAENPSLISGENSTAALLEKIKTERAASGGKKTSRKKA